MATLQDILAATNPKAIDDMADVAANSSALKMAKDGMTADQLASINASPDKLSRVVGEAAKLKGATPPSPVAPPVVEAPLVAAAVAPPAAEAAPATDKISKLAEDLHSLPEEQLSKFGKLGEFVKNSKLAQAAGKLAKPLGLYGAVSETGDAVDSAKKGEYGNATGHGLGALSGLATMAGSEAAIPLALGSVGVLGGMKQGKNMVDYGVDENGMNFDPSATGPDNGGESTSPGIKLAMGSNAEAHQGLPPVQGEGPVSDPKQYAQTVDGVLTPGEDDSSDDEDSGGDTPSVNGHTNGMAREKLLALMNQYRGMGNQPSDPNATSLPSVDAKQTGTKAAPQGPQSTLQKILAQAAEQRRNANIMGGIDRISAGIAGLGSNAPIKATGQEAYQDMAKQADQGAKDYVLQKEQEKNDPNSPSSKSVRDYLKPMLSKMGMDPKTLDNMSAADIDKNFPMGMKMYEGEQNRISREQIMKLKQQQMAQSSADKMSEKQAAANKLEFARFANRLPTIGGAQANVLRGRANQASNIFNTFQLPADMSMDDVEKLDPKQLDNAGRLLVTESSVELNKLLSGSGSPAQKTLEKIVPHNILMDRTKLQDYFQSKMNPAKQGEFAKEILKIAARVKKSASEELNSIAQKDLSRTGHFRDDPALAEDYRRLLETNGFTDPDEYIEKMKSKQAGMTKSPSSGGPKPGKTVVKKGYNAKTNQTQFIYSDGSKEIVDGQQ